MTNQTSSHDLRTMADVRAAIDAIDADLVALLARRLDAIRRASEIKSDPSQARVPWRVEEVAAKVRARAAEVGFDPALAERIWRAMMEECIAFEEDRLATRRSA